ncbi:MAG: hypothetical protein KDK37_03520 [Leptospiraceae bacterium]|nr:hypothetical protein [Leptospiraceae bacterium]
MCSPGGKQNRKLGALAVLLLFLVSSYWTIRCQKESGTDSTSLLLAGLVLAGPSGCPQIIGDGLTLCGDTVVSLEVSREEFDRVAPWPGIPTADARRYTKELLFSRFRDDFDYVVFLINDRNAAAGGWSRSVSQDVTGLGFSPFDNGALYGTSGNLNAVIYLTTLGAITGGPFLHEIMHTWGNYVLPSESASHWGLSSAGGQLGGWDPDTFQDLGYTNGNGKNVYQASKGESYHYFGVNANGGNCMPYSPIELYLMGLIPSSEVPDIKVAVNPEPEDFPNGIFAADSIDTVTIDDIIADHGLRTPGPSSSQKHFRVLTVILTPTALTNEDWNLVLDDIREMEAPTKAGYCENFASATGYRATIQFGDLNNSLR